MTSLIQKLFCRLGLHDWGTAPVMELPITGIYYMECSACGCVSEEERGRG